MRYQFELTKPSISLINTVDSMNRATNDMDPKSESASVFKATRDVLLSRIGKHIQYQWKKVQTEQMG